MRRGWLACLVLGAVLATGAGCSSGDTPPTDEAGDGGTPPPLSTVEARVVEALATLGLQGERAELPGPDGASIWVPETEPDPLQVVAYPVSSSRGDFEVRGEQEISGVTVETVEFTSGIVQRQFACEGMAYAVGGPAPGGFDGLDDFLEAFIEALGCGA